MNNAVNLLMDINQELLKKPTKEVEIPRLSEVVKEPFKVEIKALNMGQLKETVKAVDVDDITGNFDYACWVARYGMLSPSLTDKDLQKHLGVNTWEDLINKLFLPGEVMTISQEILSISDIDGASMKKKSNKKKKAEVE